MSKTGVEQAAETLGASIKASPTAAAFQKAQEDFEADAQTVQLLEKQAEVQTRIQAAQASGNIAASDLEELASIQKTVQTRVNDYLASQEALRSLVLEVNREINQLLGFNFSSLSRRNGCCG